MPAHHIFMGFSLTEWTQMIGTFLAVTGAVYTVARLLIKRFSQLISQPIVNSLNGVKNELKTFKLEANEAHERYDEKFKDLESSRNNHETRLSRLEGENGK